MSTTRNQRGFYPNAVGNGARVKGAMDVSLSKRYEPGSAEPALRDFWQRAGIYHFRREDQRPIYAIDTPPPTVSGNLHLGHTLIRIVHTDFHGSLLAYEWLQCLLSYGLR